jgi:hypothetical protein
MAASLPRIASVVVYISAQQPMRQGAWRWGPTWKLPNGLNGAWALNEAENVAVRCENVDGLAPRSTDWLERALDAAMNAEAIAQRNDYLRDHLWREAGLKPETGTRRPAPRPRTPKARLATAVEQQLDEILRQA